MDRREAFEPDAQSPEIVYPCEGTLDDPASLAKAAAVRLSTASDLSSDTGSAQRFAIFVVVVAAIGLHDDGL
ncbi:hypothetical protein WT60_04215 [Burkholderia sp. MSMB617WGS]|nr:hypothetical protein WT60_04215 [Burkholderia sp. MSMB617WGS]